MVRPAPVSRKVSRQDPPEEQSRSRNHRLSSSGRPQCIPAAGTGYTVAGAVDARRDCVGALPIQRLELPPQARRGGRLTPADGLLTVPEQQRTERCGWYYFSPLPSTTFVTLAGRRSPRSARLEDRTAAMAARMVLASESPSTGNRHGEPNAGPCTQL